MNRETADQWCERIILGLVLAILVFAPLALGAAGTWEFLVVQGLTIAVMLAWAARLWISPKPQLLWPPICWAALAFTVYAVARYCTADIEYVARQELIQVLVCAFLFFAVINNLYRQEYAQVISFTLIFLATGIAGYAVYQFMTHSAQVWNLVSPYPGRGMGTFFSPDKFAGFLAMLLPLALAYTVAGRMKPVTRVLLGYATLVLLAGLAVTSSRGGWVAAAAGLLTLLGILVSQRNHRIPAILLLAVLVGGGIFFVRNYLSKTTTYINRVEKLPDKREDFVNTRLLLWTAAVQMWRDNFWWGVGPGLYDYRYPAYRSELIQGRPGHAHNDYLNLLADWGAVGGGIVLAGLAAFAAGLVKTSKCVRRAEKDFGSGTSNRLAFFLGASTGLLALAVHSLVDFNLHIPANAMLGVALVALLSSNWRFATERYWLNLRLPVRTLTTLALVCGVAYLGAQERRRAREYVRLAQAERLPEFSPERIAAWEKAFDVEPANFETAHDIGEAYRVESFIGNPGYESLADSAMQWYQRAGKLNPYDGLNDLGCGICLDWLERHDEAGPCFNRADLLAPNNYYVAGYTGWHYAQIGDYAAARTWLQRSLKLQNDNPAAGSLNPIARSYLQMVEQRLMEEANGQTPR